MLDLLPLPQPEPAPVQYAASGITYASATPGGAAATAAATDSMYGGMYQATSQFAASPTASAQPAPSQQLFDDYVEQTGQTVRVTGKTN